MACEDFDSGVIMEEITDDNAMVPFFEGKIVGKVQKIEWTIFSITSPKCIDVGYLRTEAQNGADVNDRIEYCHRLAGTGECWTEWWTLSLHRVRAVLDFEFQIFKSLISLSFLALTRKFWSQNSLWKWRNDRPTFASFVEVTNTYQSDPTNYCNKFVVVLTLMRVSVDSSVRQILLLKTRHRGATSSVLRFGFHKLLRSFSFFWGWGARFERKKKSSFRCESRGVSRYCCATHKQQVVRLLRRVRAYGQFMDSFSLWFKLVVCLLRTKHYLLCYTMYTCLSIFESAASVVLCSESTVFHLLSTGPFCLCLSTSLKFLLRLFGKLSPLRKIDWVHNHTCYCEGFFTICFILQWPCWHCRVLFASMLFLPLWEIKRSLDCESESGETNRWKKRTDTDWKSEFQTGIEYSCTNFMNVSALHFCVEFQWNCVFF